MKLSKKTQLGVKNLNDCNTGLASIGLAVVLRNEAQNLPELLESFEKEILEKYSNEFCLLFVDNHSSDESLNLLKKWKQKVDSQVSVQITERESNNLAEARQQALDWAPTPWLVFIDGDTCLQPGWGTQINRLILGLPENVAGVGGGSFYVESKPWHRFVKPLENQFPLGRSGGKRVDVVHAPTNNFLVLVDKARKAGGFDPFFQRVGEDLDFTVRLRRQGRLFYDPIFSLSHRLPAYRQQWYEKMALYGRAQSFVFLKYGGEVPAVKFLPLLFVLFLPVFIVCFPLISLGLTFILGISARLRFLGLSFLFYGLGELIGGFYSLFHIAFNLRFFYDTSHRLKTGE